MTDYTTLRSNLLAHYIRLAQIPGWRQYARVRLETMAKDQPALWGDFPAVVSEAMKTTQTPKNLS